VWEVADLKLLLAVLYALACFAYHGRQPLPSSGLARVAWGAVNSTPPLMGLAALVLLLLAASVLQLKQRSVLTVRFSLPFVHGTGNNPLTQEFWHEKVLRGMLFRGAERERGKTRRGAFLLSGCCKRAAVQTAGAHGERIEPAVQFPCHTCKVPAVKRCFNSGVLARREV